MADNFICGRYKFNLKRPLIMGIINVTPDSFSDGGLNFDAQTAIKHGRMLANQGADILDIGAESTRPGATPVTAEQELQRLLPVIEALLDLDIPISVDTFKPEVMHKALQSGASMINDITGFINPESIDVISQYDCGLCVMHMQGTPQTMQANPVYSDLVTDIHDFLQKQCEKLEQAGIEKQRIVLDPGFGFGKTQKQNYELLRSMPNAIPHGYPWLVGVSRKSMIGHVTGRDVKNRLSGSLVAAIAAVQRQAAIVRVHDVQETVDAIKVWQAIEYGTNL